MKTEATQTERKPGLGLFPFFNDPKVYHCLKLIAGIQKQRPASVIFDAVRDYYSVTAKQPLDGTDVDILHEKLLAESTRLKFPNVFAFIEKGCGVYIEKQLELLKPRVDRGRGF